MRGRLTILRNSQVEIIKVQYGLETDITLAGSTLLGELVFIITQTSYYKNKITIFRRCIPYIRLYYNGSHLKSALNEITTGAILRHLSGEVCGD